jgi:uncharacterized protein YmfQ (DUF2313 family)
MTTVLPPDVFVRRTDVDYQQAFSALLPSGPAWSRDPTTVAQSVYLALMQIWGAPTSGPNVGGYNVDSRAADLLENESDPRAALQLLPDWEKAWGLPDPCVAEPLTIADRRTVLVQKMTMLGAQSRAFFIAQAAVLGYIITIREFSPFMCGISRCGDTRSLLVNGEAPDGVHYRWEIGDVTMRFYWVVTLMNLGLAYFHVSSGQCGIDPLLRIKLATDLECVIRRWAPAHTIVIFDYAPASSGDAYYSSGDEQF